MKIEINIPNPFKFFNYNLKIVKNRFMQRVAGFYSFLNLDSCDYLDCQRVDEMDSTASICINIALGLLGYVIFSCAYIGNSGWYQIPLIAGFFSSMFFVVVKLVLFAYFLMHIITRTIMSTRKEDELGDTLVKLFSFWFGFFSTHIIAYVFFNIIL